MSEDRDGIKVVSILGNDYSIKAPVGELQTLVSASVMLNTALADTKRKYPSLIGDKLLVLAALNLCSQQIELKQQHKQELDRVERCNLHHRCLRLDEEVERESSGYPVWVSDLVQQKQELLDINAALNVELAQAKDDNESLQLSLMEQEEKQGATAARIQALVERASTVSA